MIPSVEKLMTKKIYSIDSWKSVHEAAEEMAQNEIGSLLVTREGSYIGIITEVDIVRKVVAKKSDPSAIPIFKVMSSPLITIGADRSVLDANDLMEQKRVRHLGVTRGEEVVGIISVRDFLHPLYMEQEASGF